MNDAQIKHIYELADRLERQLESTQKSFQDLKDVIDHEESKLKVNEDEF